MEPLSLESIPGVCQISIHEPAGVPHGWLLVEVPHGATQAADYFSLAAQMKSALPAELEHFFFVNTDIGAPEGAAWLAQALPTAGIGVVVARCLFPRTFIDPNRAVTTPGDGRVVDGITPGLAPYIDASEDLALLTSLHRTYHRLVDRAYSAICGERAGLALQLHTYAPRSVGIEVVDRDIVNALHAAYEPDVYATWPERPAVDLICALPDGSWQSAPELVAALVTAYADDEIVATRNATYGLHPSTMGYVYAKAWPGRVLCVELNRGLVASPFTPFGESPIDPAKIERMVAPIARVVSAHFVGGE